MGGGIENDWQRSGSRVEFVVSPEDAQDTLEFTEALIEYVFTYRDKIESFKKRRAKASSPSDKEHTL